PHSWPSAHLLPQAPQLFTSCSASTQSTLPSALQLVNPAGQPTQVPCVQRSEAAHWWPQPPQLALSLAKFAQYPVPPLPQGLGAPLGQPPPPVLLRHPAINNI